MELDVSDHAAGIELRLVDALGIKPEIPNRLSHRPFKIQSAHQREAAQERLGKPDSLFLGKRDHLNLKRQPLSRQPVHQRQSDHHAERPIERPGIWNRIDVRPNDQTPLTQPWVHPAKVPDRVGLDEHFQRLHPFGDRLVASVHGRREKRSREPGGVLREPGQRPAARDRLFRQKNLRFCGLSHQPACFS